MLIYGGLISISSIQAVYCCPTVGRCNSGKQSNVFSQILKRSRSSTLSTSVKIMLWNWVHNECRHIDGLVQEIHNSNALAMELRLSFSNPSILCFVQHIIMIIWLMYYCYLQTVKMRHSIRFIGWQMYIWMKNIPVVAKINITKRFSLLIPLKKYFYLQHFNCDFGHNFEKNALLYTAVYFSISIGVSW